MTKEELKQELIDTEEFTREEVDKMSSFDRSMPSSSGKAFADTPAKYAVG